jgi:hypothetical protein
MVTKTVKDADFCIMFLSEILSRLLYTLSSDEVSGVSNGSYCWWKWSDFGNYRFNKTIVDYCASPIWNSFSPSLRLLSNLLTLGCSPSLSREVPWMKSLQSQFQKVRCVAWDSSNIQVIQKVTLSFTPYSLCCHPHPLFQRLYTK